MVISNYFKTACKNWEKSQTSNKVDSVSMQIQRQYLESNKDGVQLFAQLPIFQLPVLLEFVMYTFITFSYSQLFPDVSCNS